MTEMLERRYQRLMRWYPAAYRAERSDEMLDTLMADAGEGQRRPGARDTWALVVGGLRARAGVDRQLRISANVWMAIRMGLVLYLGYRAAIEILTGEDRVRLWIRYGANQRPSPLDERQFAIGLLCAAIAVLIWMNRRRSVIAVTMIMVASGFWRGFDLDSQLNVWMAGLTMVVVAGSRRHREAPSLPLSWIGVAITYGVARIIWPPYVAPYLPRSWYPVELVVMLFGLSALAAAWSIVDGRLALAIAVNAAIVLTVNGYFEIENALRYPHETNMIDYTNGWSIAEYVVPVAVATFGIVRLRRQSAL